MNHTTRSPKHQKRRKKPSKYGPQTGAIEISPLALIAGLVMTAAVGGAAVFLLVSAPPAPMPVPSQPTQASAKVGSPAAPAPAPAPVQVPDPAAPQAGASNAPGAAPMAPAPTDNTLGPAGPAPPPMPQPNAAPPAQPSGSPPPPAQAKEPKIDLKSVEYALWRTKPKKEGNFKGWMQGFEDEINTIYFATLRRRYPKAAPATLMPRPVRVEPRRVNGMLALRGYINVDDRPGYQKGKDKLLFVFEQRKPYRKGDRKLSYALYDNTGYYYRPPSYSATIQVDTPPAFVDLFVEPSWQATYYRPRFTWFHQPRWWATPYRSARVNYYFGSYPTYRVHYRRHYRAYYRPPGWRGTFYFKRSWYRHRWSPRVRIRGGINIGAHFGIRGRVGHRGRLGIFGRRRYRRGKYRRGKYRRRRYRRGKYKRRKWKRRKWKRRKYKRRGWGHRGRGRYRGRRGGKW